MVSPLLLSKVLMRSLIKYHLQFFVPGLILCLGLTGVSVFFNKSFAQSTDREFEELYKSVNAKKSSVAGLSKLDSNYADNVKLANETFQLLDYLYSFMRQELNMNGRGSFNFAGNENSRNSTYYFGAGIGIDQGLYPYELDFSADIQTLLSNGSFTENESNIDISFDFNPFVPDPEYKIKKYETKIKSIQSQAPKTETERENNEYLLNKYTKKIDKAYNANGLWLENYIIAKRFSDGYLGIEHRYEFGGGFIFSFYSKGLTRKGENNRDEINRKPTYKFIEQDLIRCLRSCAPVHNVLELSPDDIRVISDSRTRYLVANRKAYGKLRASLLLGGFYEIEKTNIRNTIQLNGKDTTMLFDFNPTNRFKAVIRPGLVWKPKDKYKFRAYCHVLVPMDRIKNVVAVDSYRDERLDYFIYFNTTLDIEIERRFSIGLYYRYFYDNAPNRVFIKQLDNSYVLLEGEKQKSSFGISLNFGF